MVEHFSCKYKFVCVHENEHDLVITAINGIVYVVRVVRVAEYGDGMLENYVN